MGKLYEVGVEILNSDADGISLHFNFHVITGILIYSLL